MNPTLNLFEQFRAATEALAANHTAFLGMGLNLTRMLGAIMVVWTGIMIALSGDVDYGKIIRQVFIVGLAYMLLLQYPELVTTIARQGTFMVGKLGGFSGLGELSRQANGVADALKVPWGPLSIAPFFTWLFAQLLIIAAMGIIYLVIAWGAIGQTVCVILGPVLIPWLIVPKMDWLFWSWLRAFIQYSMYQVVAAIVVKICAAVLVAGFMQLAAAAGQQRFQDFAFLLPITAVYFLAACGALLKIPTLVREVFSGSTGSESGIAQMAMGTTQKAGTMAARAAM